MDFSKVVIVEKANPRTPEKVKVDKPTFHLKVDYTKDKLLFSPFLFDQIQLEHNSLTQAIGPENELLLILCPGNSGVFAKTQTGGAKKGRSFKNLKFTSDLKSRNWLGGKFNLELIGSHEDKDYYKVIPFTTTEATENAQVETATSVEAEEESFN